jgi:hypothetical protein
MRYPFLCAALATAVSALAALPGGAGAAEREDRPQRISGHPNLNGLWQALNTANWNLEAHSAADLDGFWRLGALAAIPAGQSVVVGGEIPYRPDAVAQREANRAAWPEADPETHCYMPGIPRAAYMPYPFEIVQGDGDVMLFVYSFATANRPVFMGGGGEAPVDMWMGHSNGHWDGDTLVIDVNSNSDKTWLDRSGNYHSAAMKVTERYSLVDENHLQYEATIDDPQVFTRPWTIRMPLYRVVDPNARLLDFKCVEFAERLLYGPLMKEPPPE